MIRVLLVDDHPVVRTGYLHLLEQAGDIQVVAQAADVHTGYAAFTTFLPDLCITDLSLPGAGGLVLLHKILAHSPSAKVLVFSMYDTPALVTRALEGGAKGFVSKNAAPHSLLDAVHQTQQGNRYLSPGLSPTLLHQTPSEEAQRIATLSPREFEIFRLLALGKSATHCAQTLHLSPKTIANNQTLIKEKLGVSTTAALVHLALRNAVIGGAGEFSPAI